MSPFLFLTLTSPFPRSWVDSVTSAYSFAILHPLAKSLTMTSLRVVPTSSMPRTLLARTELPWRSEEHTSELQSLRHIVCRLLLEKKKKKNTNPYSIQQIKYNSNTNHYSMSESISYTTPDKINYKEHRSQ